MTHNEQEKLIERLEALAKVADRDSWEASIPTGQPAACYITSYYDIGAYEDMMVGTRIVAENVSPENAEFFLAANPQAILELTALVRQLQSEALQARNKALEEAWTMVHLLYGDRPTKQTVLDKIRNLKSQEPKQS